MTAPEMLSEVSESADKQCPHRLKKNLFDATHVQRVLKNKKKQQICDNCDRSSKNNNAAAETEGKEEKKIFICTADGCSLYKCGYFETEHPDCHMHQHAENTQHMIFYNMKEHRLWCNECAVELLPDEENASDNVKRFLDAIPKRAQEKEKPVENVEVVEVDAHAVSNKRTRNVGARNHQQTKLEEKKKENGIVNGMVNLSVDTSGLPHVKGLRNIGNTCFYNSVMQCVMHTHLMQDYLDVVAAQDKWASPRRNNFKMPDREPFVLPKRTFEYAPSIFRGFVFNALRQLFVEFRAGVSIEPGTLLDMIRKSYNRTVLPYGSQCDAGEYFMLFTECLETEERKLRKLVVKKHEFAHFKKIPVEDAIVAYQKVADSPNMPTRIDAVFGLVYVQFIKCEDKTCNHISTRLTTSRQLLLNLSFLSHPSALARNKKKFAKNTDESGRQMSKYRQKKMLEKRKKEARRQRKSTGPSLSTSQSHAEDVELEIDHNDEVEEIKHNSCPRTSLCEGSAHEESIDEGVCIPFGPPAYSDQENAFTDPEPESEIVFDFNGNDVNNVGSDLEVQISEAEEDEDEHGDSGMLNGSNEEAEEDENDVPTDGMDTCKLQATIGTYVKRTDAPHIMDCLANWAAENELSEYQCDSCCPEKSKKRVDATQRFLLFAPPPVLVLCLERVSMGNRKVQTQVKFDLLLDIGPFCVNYGLRFSNQQRALKYGLYGVVIHEGCGSSWGHYIACVRRRKPPTNIRHRFEEAFTGGSADQEALKKRMQDLMEETRQVEPPSEHEDSNEPSENDQWYCISDNHYRQTSWSEVRSKQAFMLFYERLD